MNPIQLSSAVDFVGWVYFFCFVLFLKGLLKCIPLLSATPDSASQVYDLQLILHSLEACCTVLPSCASAFHVAVLSHSLQKLDVIHPWDVQLPSAGVSCQFGDLMMDQVAHGVCRVLLQSCGGRA